MDTYVVGEKFKYTKVNIALYANNILTYEHCPSDVYTYKYTITHRWTTVFFWVSSADATRGTIDVSIADDKVDNTIRRECIISPW